MGRPVAREEVGWRGRQIKKAKRAKRTKSARGHGNSRFTQESEAGGREAQPKKREFYGRGVG